MRPWWSWTAPPPRRSSTLALPGLIRPEGIYVLGDLAWLTDAVDGALSVVMIDEAAE